MGRVWSTKWNKRLIDSEKIYAGTGSDTEYYFDGTDQILKSAGGLKLQTSGDTDDYVHFYTASNLPRAKVLGGSAWFIESDDAAHVGVFAYQDATHCTFIDYDKSASEGEIGCSDLLKLQYSNAANTQYHQKLIAGTSTADSLDLTAVAGNVSCIAATPAIGVPIVPPVAVPAGYIQVNLSGVANPGYLAVWA